VSTRLDVTRTTPTASATLVFDERDRVAYATEAACAAIGMDVDRLAGAALDEVLSKAGRKALARGLGKARAGETVTVALSFARGAGRVPKQRGAFALRCEPLRGGDARSIVATVVTATEQPEDQPAETETSESAILDSGLRLLIDAGRRIGATLELTETAQEFVNVTVPRFADAAGVYVMERLLAEDELPSRGGDAVIEVRRVAVASAATGTERIKPPNGDTVALSPDTPFAECLNYGRPIVLDSDRALPCADDGLAEFWRDALEVQGPASILVLPLGARGTQLGFVWLLRGARRGGFGRQEVAIALELAQRAAVSIDNALLYDRERRVAVALQSSLQPGVVEVPAGLSVAHRYLPCRNAAVGGDWYDVVALPGGRAALVVGDVMGHGMRAASVMGQLRTAVRAFASLDLPPTEILGRLDAMAAQQDVAQFATCLYAVCDPSEGSCLIARAGHVPPILVDPRGKAAVIEVPSGMPLGIGGGTYEACHVPMEPGSTLAMCTDGLVESRRRDIDEGISLLRTALGYEYGSLENACDALLQLLPDRTDGDDVTLMLARMEGR
jgi:hypothetical protein